MVAPSRPSVSPSSAAASPAPSSIATPPCVAATRTSCFASGTRASSATRTSWTRSRPAVSPTPPRRRGAASTTSRLASVVVSRFPVLGSHGSMLLAAEVPLSLRSGRAASVSRASVRMALSVRSRGLRAVTAAIGVAPWRSCPLGRDAARRGRTVGRMRVADTTWRRMRSCVCRWSARVVRAPGHRTARSGLGARRTCVGHTFGLRSGRAAATSRVSYTFDVGRNVSACRGRGSANPAWWTWASVVASRRASPGASWTRKASVRRSVESAATAPSAVSGVARARVVVATAARRVGRWASRAWTISTARSSAMTGSARA